LDSNNTETNNSTKNRQDLSVRIAVYDNMRSIPRVIKLDFDSIENLINETSQRTYNLSHEAGGNIPYTIIREIIENLIHADFREVVVTILDNGNHIIISDQGPGITDREKAFLPGYTSATKKMKEYIRGIGSGLPIVKETITFSGGTIDVNNNIKTGTVVSLKLTPGLNKTNISTIPTTNIEDSERNLFKAGTFKEKIQTEDVDSFDSTVLSDRHHKILFIILELSEAGPSTIARELGFSLSTSYRELIYLEKNNFLVSGSNGKRKLSKKGVKYLEYYSNNI
jgi:predicted transcriptional regulator